MFDPDVVITGLALRLPGARNIAALWDILRDGRDCTAPVSARRRLLAGAPDWDDVIGEVADIDAFDAEFFDIEPDEARSMDPQHRLLMELAQEALGDAGLLEVAPRAGRRYATLAALATNAYYPLLCAEIAAHGTSGLHPRTIMNNMNSAAAARISHLFNLTGPAAAVDTACSSFLAAVAQGIELIRSGDCDGAVIAGANLLSSRFTTELCNAGGITTQHPFTRVFDAAADGTLIGEGAVVCVLERSDVAAAGNRRILGQLRACAINNDGSALNIMAPNPRGQAHVVAACYSGQVSPGDVSYIECHGTGTRIGDPIELNALGDVFTPATCPHPVGIGSIKSNIGHLLSAAGGAGLAKLLACLAHDEQPPHLHLDDVNPLLQLDETPFRLVSEPTPLAGAAADRCGAITSLGLGGTNVHMVVSTGSVAPSRPPGPVPVVVSAKSPAALAEVTDAVRALWADPATDRYAVALTLGRYRPELPWRAVLATSLDTDLVPPIPVAVPRPARRVRVAPSAHALAERLRSLVRCKVELTDAPGRDDVVVPGPGAPPLPPLDPDADDATLASALFLYGVPLRWAALFPDTTGAIVSGLHHPMNRQSYWL